jgi:hypothetical protein
LVKSQTQQQEAEGGYSISNEELNEDLILHCWRLVQEQVKRVVDFNREAGLKNPEAYIGYGFASGTTEPMDVKQKRRWWAVCTHKRTGKLITLDTLLASGRISDLEKELFEGQKLPRRELSQLIRGKTQDNSQYLMRLEQWIGLSEIGGIVTVSVNDLDFTRRIGVTPTTAKQTDGTEIKVLEVGTAEFAWGTLPKIYTTPFTKENVMAAIEKAQTSTENNAQGKISYQLLREGYPNPISVSSLKEFIEGNLDEIWARQTTPNPQININQKTW